MNSFRISSLALTCAVHVTVLGLAWMAFGPSRQVGEPGHRGVVSFRSVDLSRPDETPQAEPAPDPPRKSLAVANATDAPAPTVRPVVQVVAPVSPLRLSDDMAPAPAVPLLAASRPPSSNPGSGVTAGSSSGEGKAAAQDRAAPPSAGSRGEDSYARRVFAWIGRHKGYPGRLARKGWEGTALVRLLIDENGRLETAELVGSSGHPPLDGLALKQVRDAVPYPRPPKGLPRAGRQFLVPMTYQLEG